MQQPLSPGARTVSTPSFYLTARQPLRPGVILLAILAAAGLLCGIIYALSHSRHALLNSGGPDSMQSGGGASGESGSGDDDDDPNQVDTIALGDPSEAPVPAHPGTHPSS